MPWQLSNSTLIGDFKWERMVSAFLSVAMDSEFAAGSEEVTWLMHIGSSDDVPRALIECFSSWFMEKGTLDTLQMRNTSPTLITAAFEYIINGKMIFLILNHLIETRRNYS